jgi:uncharacterized ferritin-like protein (DUF455 family)
MAAGPATDGATLAAAAVAVLEAADPRLKARLTRETAEAWRRGEIAQVGTGAPPARPARPEQPPLKAPREVPRRRISAGPRGRIALLHALAHIELNAIDLAWDLIARFAGPELPRGFADDWVKVAEEEARHFGLLSRRLRELGARYGDLPAHDGLWQAAEATAHDLLARLAVVPLVLEARGLDVTPAMIAKLEAAGDGASAGILETIYRDEIGHVAIGRNRPEMVRVALRDPGANPGAGLAGPGAPPLPGRLEAALQRGRPGRRRLPHRHLPTAHCGAMTD